MRCDKCTNQMGCWPDCQRPAPTITVDGAVTPWPTIIIDPNVPLGMIEIRHPDGRRERVHCNFP